MLLSYGVVDQMEPGGATKPGADPMAIGVTLLELLDRLQSEVKSSSYQSTTCSGSTDPPLAPSCSLSDGSGPTKCSRSFLLGSAGRPIPAGLASSAATPARYSNPSGRT